MATPTRALLRSRYCLLQQIVLVPQPWHANFYTLTAVGCNPQTELSRNRCLAKRIDVWQKGVDTS